MAYNNKFYLGDYVRIVEIGELMDSKSDNKEWINAVNVTGETPLHIAARRRIFELFESMLPYYVDIEACDDQGNTVLHQLVDSNVESDEENKKKRIDMLHALISKGADVNKKNRNGRAPVHLAAKNGHIEILETLKQSGADFSLLTNDGESPLLLACKHMFKLRGTSAETAIVDFLLECDCDVNAMDDEGYSALHYAIEWCSGSTVVKLVERGANVHLRSREHKLTPLHLAARRKNTTKVDILIEAGASVKAEDVDLLLPLHLALLESTPIVVERLIDYGSDINFPERILQLTPLHLAVLQQRDDLFQLLIDGGANVNGSGEGALTPLHLSSMLGNVDYTKALINHGADVNCRDRNQSTPLHLAIRKNHDLNREVDGIKGTKAIIHGKTNSLIVSLLNCQSTPKSQDYQAVVRLLIDSGAHVNAVTKFGRNPLHLAAEAGVANSTKVLSKVGSNFDYEEASSEHLDSDGSYKDLAEILMNAGVDVNASNENGQSPMHSAVASNYVDILKLLVQRGANLNNIENLLGFTPLHLALYTNHMDAAEFLIDAGADLNVLSKNGSSPTYLAVELGRTEVLEILVKFGANVDLTGVHAQFTPLHLALSKNNKYSAEILINAGADVNALTQNGNSPIHLALESNCTGMLKLLVERGAKFNCKRNRCLYSLSYIFARNNDEDMIDRMNDLDKTPLLHAINSLEDIDVKRALFCLPAFVDAHNVGSCMSINDEVNIDYKDNCECLRIFGMNVNDFDGFCKFVFDRVMNAAFEESDNILNYLISLIAVQFLNYDCETYVCQTIDDFLVPYIYDYETYIWRSIRALGLHNGESSYYRKCLEEVEKLKSYSISKGVTLYSLLHMKYRRRRVYTNNLDFGDIELKFPIYCKLILTRCRETIIRRSLLDAVHLAFCQLTKVDIPILCIEEISLSLDVMNIIAIIEAAEIVE